MASNVILFKPQGVVGCKGGFPVLTPHRHEAHIEKSAGRLGPEWGDQGHAFRASVADNEDGFASIFHHNLVVPVREG